MTSPNTLCNAIELSSSMSSHPIYSESTEAQQQSTYVNSQRIKRKLPNLKLFPQTKRKVLREEPVTPHLIPKYPPSPQSHSGHSASSSSSANDISIFISDANSKTITNTVHVHPNSSPNHMTFAQWLDHKRDSFKRKRHIITDEEYDILVNLINNKNYVHGNQDLTWAKHLIATTGITVIKQEIEDQSGLMDILVKPREPSHTNVPLQLMETNSSDFELFKRYYKIAKYSQIENILVKAHLDSGHAGYKNLYARIKHKYLYIKRDMCMAFKQRCVICSRSSALKTAKEQTVNPIDGKETFHHLVIDLIDFRATPAGPTEEYKYVAHLVDHLSTFHYTEAIREKSGAEVLHFLRKIFSLIGFPAVLHSDNGSEFRNQLVENYLKIHNIKFNHGKPYKAKTQGKVERSNRTLQVLWPDSTFGPTIIGPAQ
jgi:hypothetical protein